MCAYSVYTYICIFLQVVPSIFKKTLATATKTMMYMLETYGIYIYIYTYYIYIYMYIHTMSGPPVISWFIAPLNTSYT